jgi:hypothetical protein
MMGIFQEIEIKSKRVLWNKGSLRHMIMFLYGKIGGETNEVRCII